MRFESGTFSLLSSPRLEFKVSTSDGTEIYLSAEKQWSLSRQHQCRIDVLFIFVPLIQSAFIPPSMSMMEIVFDSCGFPAEANIVYRINNFSRVAFL